MNPRKILRLTYASLVATVSLPVNGKLSSLVPAVIAQNEQTEAYRLNERGIQQYQTSQFREALQSWEKALQIYREIKNRQGEAAVRQFRKCLRLPQTVRKEETSSSNSLNHRINQIAKGKQILSGDSNYFVPSDSTKKRFEFQ
ncbi:MAG UNVERIFIED_CONTAM: hypothetical protein LVR29_30120 [Microcystis novacekii LVE1205-3]